MAKNCLVSSERFSKATTKTRPNHTSPPTLSPTRPWVSRLALAKGSEYMLLPSRGSRVSKHILGRIKEPLDLSKLRAVSRCMLHAVRSTGHRVVDLEAPDTGKRLAAHDGYLSTLKHLHRRGCLDLQDKLFFALAIEGEQFEVMDWLRSIGCACDMTTFEAPVFGKLETLKWMRANDYQWDKDTCAAAASRGHLEILQWTNANGCPWDWRTSVYATKNGRRELLNWAIANGCPQQFQL